MDSMDLQILRLLRINARLPQSEIGRRVHLTIPSVAARLRKMEERGIIRGYTVKLDPARVSRGLTAITLVTIDHPRCIQGFVAAVSSAPEVIECHHTAGDSDYLLKIAVPDVTALDRFISRFLKAIDGVRATRTMVVLSTLKDTFGVDPPDDPAPPLAHEAADRPLSPLEAGS